MRKMKTFSVLLLSFTILSTFPSTLLADLLCAAGRAILAAKKAILKAKKAILAAKKPILVAKKQYLQQESNTCGGKATTFLLQVKAMGVLGTVASLGGARAPAVPSPALVLLILVKAWCPQPPPATQQQPQPTATQERKAAHVKPQCRRLCPLSTSLKSSNR